MLWDEEVEARTELRLSYGSLGSQTEMGQSTEAKDQSGSLSLKAMVSLISRKMSPTLGNLTTLGSAFGLSKMPSLEL